MYKRVKEFALEIVTKSSHTAQKHAQALTRQLPYLYPRHMNITIGPEATSISSSPAAEIHLYLFVTGQTNTSLNSGLRGVNKQAGFKKHRYLKVYQLLPSLQSTADLSGENRIETGPGRDVNI